MNPLQFIFIIAGLVFFLFAIDAYERKRFNVLHFFVFFGGSAVLLFFIFNIDLLNKFGSFFGLDRGADLIVYLSIIFLFYLYFELLNRHTKHHNYQTRIITEQAIGKAMSHGEISKIHKVKGEKGKFIFLIRSFNEEKTLPEVIDSIIKKGFKNIVIVNDGSSDHTVRLVLEKKEKYNDSNIVLLSHLINRGGGAANKTGFEFVKRYYKNFGADYMVTFDADGQMNIGDIDLFISKLKESDFDVLLGSRFINGASSKDIPSIRKIILLGSRLVTLFFNGINVSDPHNGYRVIKTGSLDKINIESDNMTYASEILDEIHKNKLKYSEIPVNIVYTEYSLGKGQKNSNAFRILKDLIYKKLFYK